MSKFCGNCGAALPEGTRFCTACGTPVAGGPQPAQPAQPVPPAPAAPRQDYRTATTSQRTYGQPKPEPKPKKKGGALVGIVIALVLVAAVVCGVIFFGDTVAGLLGGGSGEIKELTSGLPTINTSIPDGGGYITSFGALSFAVPMDYETKHTEKKYTVNHPDSPKKVDQLVATHDGSYRSGDEKKTLERYKKEFAKVTTVATKELEDYTLYYIVGKREAEGKNCTATCVLILMDDEMYAVNFATSLKTSKLGMAADYLAFDPSVSWDG